MSPAATAPSKASVSACNSTSPSECPASPLSCANNTPPIRNGTPTWNSCESHPTPILGTRIACGLNVTEASLSQDSILAAVFLRQKEFCQLQVPGRSDLQVARRSHYHVYRSAGALDKRRLVSSQEAIGRRLVECPLQQSEAKALRSLRHHHPFARHSRQHHGAVCRPVNLLDCINRGNACDGGIIFLHSFNHPVDRLFIHQWTHGIVDQH